ncbi:50S ribosomal protein L25/general stress protein Ctc [Ehrlichia ruminantium]|uniref:Large ribosomal subunit protein bL25 n=3 Tax=Ehrlichia ruminantium TaxID=779 RepID=RL25_EHRRG|nr:50S ribosomal protein L25/general stress protein Ctc [Ehrlichia ruminantium]Q5FFA2.2 RecName: Full=Large ribosomal subunit protein bL25; AltName: Full=50S ribosomal protein L25; AltName: Full=General stress protein CTC [Ehrlichia ruminantium str. Gardel]Q5HC84.1 RecName: Full=Large ribosomal subunit protein bL25; AltName: Full=50S ribosomal protein L25; AltName: Full=General stress protein CTC [Ehrlichia ruminantium str. Welgevonden]UOD97974.1 50S ribosomal protein L25/general stress protein 
MTDQTIVKMNAELRNSVGTGPSRTLRRNGAIPAVVYGKHRSPLSIYLSDREFLSKYRSAALSTHLIELEIGEKKEYVLMRDIQKHPVTDRIQHVDFQFIDHGTEIKIEVPLVFVNEQRCVGVKKGGVLNILHRTLHIKCLPNAILQSIEVDLANLTIGHSIHVSDLNLPSEVTVVMKEHNPTLVTISGTSSDQDTSGGESSGTTTSED